MKATLYILVLFFCCSTIASAQTSTETKLKRISTYRYTPGQNDSTTIHIAMNFNDVKPQDRLKKLDPKKIQSITLVYTKFKVNETFDQLNLNNERIHYLYSVIPGLKETKSIQWIWIEQTGCEDVDACKDFFHGLVIKLKTEEDEFLSKFENNMTLRYMKSYESKVFNTSTLDSLADLPNSKLLKVCNTSTVKVLTQNRIGKPRTWSGDLNQKLKKLIKKELKNGLELNLELVVDVNGRIIEVNGLEGVDKSEAFEKSLMKELKFIRTRYNGKFCPTQVFMSIYLMKGEMKTDFVCRPVLPEGVVFDIDSFNYKIKEITKCTYLDTSRNVYYNTFEPPLVIKVMERHKNWKNCLVVTDVTSSMSPYVGQFLYWHKLNLNKSTSNQPFVFFNDGDNMSDNMKINGKVGGIYSVSTNNFKVLLSTVLKAQSMGNGGDIRENNFEAALEGIKQFPMCEEMVMIVDNWATPRDIELLKQIKIPIHFIICGTYCGINPVWLDLAKKNGGSVHTIESDIEKLSKLKENGSIVIDNQRFTLVNGKFKGEKVVDKNGVIKMECYGRGGVAGQ